MSVDELEEFGLERMTDDEIQQFLSTQGIGVLGLPTAEAPYLLPMSYGYDGESRLYFTYVLGASSEKASISDQADAATFLVFTADTVYNWESVSLTGTITDVSDADWEALEDVLNRSWRPDLFETAALTNGVRLYEFAIEERTGVKHTGLPPGFGEMSRN